MVMKYLRYLFRFIVGAVLIFSGFVKAIDPLGSAYKFSDYFGAFKLGFLKDISLPLAVFMSTFEMVLGIVIILGYRKRIAYWILLIFMSFFTILTLILAIFNPVSDCGCFGDALILTNWQTFLKNIVLMVFVSLLFEDRNRKYLDHGLIFEWSVIGLLLVSGILLSEWNIRHLPLIDFRPYDIGTNINDEMSIPEGETMDQYETILYYRNRTTGKVENFTIQDYPKDTIQWKFEDSKSKLVRKGYEPPIQDFALLSPFDQDITDDLLNDPGYSLLMITYDIDKSKQEPLQMAEGWAGLEKIAGDFHFYAITASLQERINAVKRENELDYDFYTADETMLMTIIRSNPGFVLIKNGTVIGKWGWRDFAPIAKIDSTWPDMIEKAGASFDDETLQLMEEGILDNLSFDVVQFDRAALKLLFGDFEKEHSRMIAYGYIMAILLIIAALQIIVIVKRRKS